LDEVRVVGVRSYWWEQKPDATRHWARTPRFTDEYPLEDVELSLMTPKLDRAIVPRGPTGAESLVILAGLDYRTPARPYTCGEATLLFTAGGLLTGSVAGPKGMVVGIVGGLIAADVTCRGVEPRK
jgi:hypothetical protein